MKDGRSETIESLFGTMEVTKRAMYAHLHCTLDKSSLGPSHIHMLAMIERMQPVQLKELSAKLHLTPSAITQTLDVLCSEGYLRREANERDRRSVFVRLTAKGKRKIKAIRKTQQDHFTRMLSGLSDSELILLLKMHQKMLDHLEHEQEESDR